MEAQKLRLGGGERMMWMTFLLDSDDDDDADGNDNDDGTQQL